MEGPDTGFPSVVPRAATAASPGTLETHILRPHPDLPNQKVWRWEQQSGRLGWTLAGPERLKVSGKRPGASRPRGQTCRTETAGASLPRAWRPAGDKSQQERPAAQPQEAAQTPPAGLAQEPGGAGPRPDPPRWWSSPRPPPQERASSGPAEFLPSDPNLGGGRSLQ